MADPARSKLKEDILNILRNSDDMLRAFRSRIENKYVIIFVGNTRNGKSTLVNYITETPLVAFEEGNLFRIEHQNGISMGPDIAHGTLSHTTVPTILEMSGRPDMVIVDAPGFDDNRGAVQEIINALYINQIKYSKGVRFVLVSDINNIINDNINYFLSFIETVHTIMPDFEKLKEAVSIIFTKDRRNYDRADIVNLLKSKVLDVDGLRCKKDLIKHFVEREDLIGLFKMPSSAGALTEEINDNINGAIFKSLPINLTETDIKFGISKSARIILLETYLEFFDVVTSLKETFKGFRTSAMVRFCNLTKEKLLPLTRQQLHGEGSAQQIMVQFCNCIKYDEGQLLSAIQIPDSLQKLYVEDVDRVTAAIERIGVQVPTDSNPRFNLNTIEEVRRKLEYIACIEKVVEKDNKSKNILASYKENTDIFHNQIEELHKNIDQEVETRTHLIFQISSVPNIENRLMELDEQYLFASFTGELRNMKLHLENYIELSDKILEEISQRPELKRQMLQEINRTSSVHRNIEDKIQIISNHLENRNNKVVLKNVSLPVMGIMGTLIFYAGMTYFRSLSEPAQFRVVAGSFLLFAAISWKSSYMRTLFSRVRKRYQQNRLLTKRTKLDDCWKELYYAVPRHRFIRH